MTSYCLIEVVINADLTVHVCVCSELEWYIKKDFFLIIDNLKFDLGEKWKNKLHVTSLKNVKQRINIFSQHLTLKI
jgi:hypothetical protein